MNTELIVFIVYLVFMLGIGVFFFLKTRNGGEKDYFLGGRHMGPVVSALSAGASDMSAWVLMGLPASIYAAGLGQTWIAIGLAIGYALSWIFEAPRLRRYSIAANDSITIPQYLTNRFGSHSNHVYVDSLDLDGNNVYINKRNIVISIIFSVLTCGIYTIYWQYLLVKNIRSIKKDNRSIVGEMLCLCFVPFYSYYWWYTRGTYEKDEFSKRGFTAVGNGLVYLLLGIFGLGIVSMAIMQSDFDSLKTEKIEVLREKTNKSIQVICAVIFLVAYTVYAASSIKACGTLFNTVVGIDPKIAMYIAAAIIISYTFLGGFSAVCWTDFFQGLLMLGALLIAPIFALVLVQNGQGQSTLDSVGEGYWNMFTNWKDIASGLGWGLGYFGMPHIIIRFMSVRSDKDVKKSAGIGITWTVLILLFSVIAAISGRMFLGEISDSSTVFIQIVRKIFPAVISGVLLSAILAASMSTADSQLLSSASAFASDVYKPIFRKGKASDKEMLWVGRVVVLAIAVVALLIASAPNSGTIMDLVSNAWGVFGAAFGPVILLSLFWRRLTFAGAAAGIVTGAAVDILWLAFLGSFGLYEIIPGFVCGLIVTVVVSLLTKAPSAEVTAVFDKVASKEEI